jgi:hypothetical protein
LKTVVCSALQFIRYLFDYKADFFFFHKSLSVARYIFYRIAFIYVNRPMLRKKKAGIPAS